MKQMATPERMPRVDGLRYRDVAKDENPIRLNNKLLTRHQHIQSLVSNNVPVIRTVSEMLQQSLRESLAEAENGRDPTLALA